MPFTRGTAPKALRDKKIGLFLIYWRYFHLFVVLFVPLSAIGYRKWWKGQHFLNVREHPGVPTLPAMGNGPRDDFRMP